MRFSAERIRFPRYRTPGNDPGLPGDTADGNVLVDKVVSTYLSVFVEPSNELA